MVVQAEAEAVLATASGSAMVVSMVAASVIARATVMEEVMVMVVVMDAVKVKKGKEKKMDMKKMTINSKAYVPTAIDALKQGLSITTDIYDAYLTRLLDEIIGFLEEQINQEATQAANTEGKEKKTEEYINKEDIIKAIDKNINEASTVEEVKAMFKIKEDICSQKVITFPEDVQIVKHGRWIPLGNDMWLCSNCKENIIFLMSKSDRTEKQRYCCRCGARMDGGVE